MSEIGETSTRDTKTRSGQLQAINKCAAFPHTLAQAASSFYSCLAKSQGCRRHNALALSAWHHPCISAGKEIAQLLTQTSGLHAHRLEGRDGDGRGQRGRKRKVAASDNGNEATASRCANDEGDGDAQTHAGQNRRAPAETPQPPESGARSSERQKQVLSSACDVCWHMKSGSMHQQKKGISAGIR